MLYIIREFQILGTYERSAVTSTQTGGVTPQELKLTLICLIDIYQYISRCVHMGQSQALVLLVVHS
jgi:hypothetical protein